MPSYEKRDSGRWSVRFRDENGANRRLSGFASKREAQNAYAEYLTNRINGEEVIEKPSPENDPNNITFEEVYNLYIKDLYNHCKESSIYTISHKAEKHILPVFGKKKVVDIKPLEILEWQSDLACSTSYKIGMRELLASILKFANRIYDIPYVMPKVTPIRNKERRMEMSIWTPEEFKQFIVHVEQPYQTMFKVLFYTGMRRGEMQALTWKDIKNRTINIDKTLTSKSNEYGFAITAPKTKGSYRKVTIPDFLEEEILSLHNDGDYIFSLDNGKRPISERTIEKAWKAGISASHVHRIRIHDLRHSHASMLISSGVPITAVSRRLGHENVSVTLNTYAHMLPSDDENIMVVLKGM